MEPFKPFASCRRRSRPGLAALGAAAGVWAAAIGLLGAPPPAPAFGPSQPAPADVPAQWRRGYELAHVYCQACHLFPEPDLLDKKHWPGAFRLMAPFLGVAELDFSRRPDGGILKDAGLFPASPLISREDWSAIMAYYHQFAPEEPLPQKDPPKIQPGLSRFRPRLLTFPGSAPATSLVKIDPARRRIYLGNAVARSLDLCDPSGRLVARVPVDSPPSDLQIRGNELYLTLIGHVFPSDLPDGKLIRLQESNSTFTSRTLLANLPRPVHSAFASWNDRGPDELFVSCFGNYLGKLSRFEPQPAGDFREQVVLERPGALRSILVDADRDGARELFVLMAQAREGLFLFQRSETGEITSTPLLEFHPLFGATSFDLVDFNGDSFLDVLLTNGDNGEYRSPFKAFHGIRIYLNDGRNRFREAFFFPMNGAFKAVAADFDEDGDLDLAAISFFPDYAQSREAGFVYLQNRGDLNFEAFSLPESALGRWLTIDVGDVDGDQDLDLVLGSFIEGPPSISVPETLRAGWRATGASALLLENLGREPSSELK